ncbi:hypothetical protein MRBLMC3_000133 [Sphingobium sp. LMC3-1-1.1]
MKAKTKALLKKTLPIFQKKATWAILIAIPSAFLGLDPHARESTAELLSLAATIVSAVVK